MKTLSVLSAVGVLVGLGSLAGAQQPTNQGDYSQAYGTQYGQPQPVPSQPIDPYAQPGYAQQPAAPQYQPPPNGEAPAQVPPGDYDDDDGYDVDTDITYDNTVAENYDDGYDPNAYTQFQGALSPYGSWVEVPSYGRVWTPSVAVVGADFVPYSSGGHWVLSDYGWTWVSDWNWGWGPFHYGRWMTVGGYGWCWMPGTVWGPSWVSWRWGGGYVGWAPLPPRGVVIGPPSMGRSGWRFTVAAQLGAVRPAFLPARVVPTVFARTSVVANTRAVALGNTSVRVNAGPSAALVSSTVGHVVTPVALNRVAPHALPQAAITPHAGAALTARPWVQAHAAGTYASPQGVHAAVSSTYRSPAPAYHSATPAYRSPAPAYQTVPAFHSQAPAYRAPTPGYHPNYAPNYAAPRYNGAPAYTAPRYNSPAYSAPRYSAPYSAPHYSAPSYSAPHYSAPTYSAPAQHYSAPSYSAPHYSAPAYSAPAQHYSAPSYSAPHYSAPSVSHSYSAPHFSGGGGGGRRR